MKQYSLGQIKNMIEKGDYIPTKENAPEYPIDPDFWKTAKIVKPVAKKSVHLRLDEDVLDWFKSQGSGHLTRMQSVLKSYYEAHERP